jgi:hypothetical protein
MRGNGGPERQAAVVPNHVCTCRGHEEVAAVRCRLRRRFGPRDTRVRHHLLQQLERQRLLPDSVLAARQELEGGS